MAERVIIDAGQLRTFSRDLRSQSRRLDSDVRSGMRKSAEQVADLARILAAQHSKKIAGTIRVRAISAETVVIEAGGEDVPTAELFERGNRGQPLARTFRHPVFGNKNVIVEQEKHPFLWPALVARGGGAAKELADSIERAWARSQPHGS